MQQPPAPAAVAYFDQLPAILKGMKAHDSPPYNRPTRRTRLMVAGVLLVVCVLLSIWLWPYIVLFSDQTVIRQMVTSAGPWGPAVYIGLQALQVVVAPIPGSVIGLVGGYLFLTPLATLYSMVGSTIGFFIVFVIAKRFGRRLLRFFVPEQTVRRIDAQLEKRALPFLFVAFLLPIFPDPVVGYLAGLTPLRLRTLMVIVIVARLPGVLITSLVGSQASQANYEVVAGVLLLTAFIVALMYKYRARIDVWLDRVIEKTRH